jgi:WD40 repeat protein
MQLWKSRAIFLVGLIILIEVSSKISATKAQNASNARFSATTTIEWSHNGELLAIGGSEGVWILNNEFQETHHFDNLPGEVPSLTWSPDDSKLASALYNADQLDTGLIVTDIATGETILTINHNITSPIIWQPNGNYIAAGDYTGGIHIWDATDGEEILSFQQEDENYPSYPNSVSAVCWNTDGTEVTGLLFGSTYVLDITSGNVVVYRGVGSLHGGACNPQNTVIVTTFLTLIYLQPEAQNYQLESQSSTVDGFAVSWHPTGDLFAINREDGEIQIWGIETGEIIATLQGGMIERTATYREYHDSLAWSPDGSMLAEAGQDGIVRIWNADTYELITTLNFTE